MRSGAPFFAVCCTSNRFGSDGVGCLASYSTVPCLISCRLFVFFCKVLPMWGMGSPRREKCLNWESWKDGAIDFWCLVLWDRRERSAFKAARSCPSDICKELCELGNPALFCSLFNLFHSCNCTFFFRSLSLAQRICNCLLTLRQLLRSFRTCTTLLYCSKLVTSSIFWS